MLKDLDQIFMHLLITSKQFFFFFFLIKRSIHFWASSYIDNARVEHSSQSTKSPPAHPKGYQWI